MTPTPHELNERIKVVTGFDIPAMNAALEDLIVEREDAKAEWKTLDKLTVVMRDTAAMKFYADYFRVHKKNPSMALAEKHGNISAFYKTHLDGVEVAHKTWGRLEAKSTRLGEDIWFARQAISFAKAELNHR